MQRYIFVTGGVLSSLGKGITIASISLLLERMGYKIALLKCDPYLNVDPGTMNPQQHGEVYVTDDGTETDLDLGHYYRYSSSPLSKLSNITSGKVYNTVIQAERRGDYLGQTVQVIPHITDEIKRRILLCGEQDPEIDIVLVEIGGTVGDIEAQVFLEAIRQFRYERSLGQCINIHLTYVPYLHAAGEIKSKPTQHSVQLLRQIGITPDIIVCRCENSLPEDVQKKISLFCSVGMDSIIDEPDVKHSIYEVPLALKEQALHTRICSLMNIQEKEIDLSDWQALVDTTKEDLPPLQIAIVGKYLQHKDAYKSLFEALQHAALFCKRKLQILRVDAEALEKETADKFLSKCHACLVPGGFGTRGFEGKMNAATYCRTKKLPFLGICLGLHVLLVEFARHAGLTDAHSTEMNPHTPFPVVSLLAEQKDIKEMGGSMRLGAYPCTLLDNTKVRAAYGKKEISERHRHRYECNPLYQKELEQAGLCFSGFCPDSKLYEIAEISSHPWMIGVQFHPEFLSKPTQAHPLFIAFIQAAISNEIPEQ